MELLQRTPTDEAATRLFRLCIDSGSGNQSAGCRINLTLAQRRDVPAALNSRETPRERIASGSGASPYLDLQPSAAPGANGLVFVPGAYRQEIVVGARAGDQRRERINRHIGSEPDIVILQNSQ